MLFDTRGLPMVGLLAALGRLAATTTTAVRPAAPDGGVAHRVALTVAKLLGLRWKG
ncbi:MAG: hypothetical protein ACRDRU_15500 [Pseudonocardiaceae bacterium]